VSQPAQKAEPIPRTGLRRLGLSQRLAAAFAVIGIVAAAATAVSVWAYVRLSNARHDVVDQIDPARLQVQLLLDAYLNQETGVRGFVLSGNRSFLAPYTDGLSEATNARRSLGPLLAHNRAALTLLAAVDQQARAWSDQFALPAIAQPNTYSSPDRLNASKTFFDTLRADFANLDASLVQSRAEDIHNLHQSADILAVVLVADLIILVVAGVGAWLMLGAWVTHPVERLTGDVRQVAEGHLDHQVSPSGPPELEQLGADVDSMRRRLMDELREVQKARAGLADANSELEHLNADLARSNLELEQFAYVASHDLQEPLRKITGFTELLRRRYGDQLDERAKQYMDFAADGALRMQVLINDLLAFSRVGRTTERFVPVRLEDALDDALDNLDALLSETGTTVDADPLPSVSGDRALLAAVFQNLISNAIKFRSKDAPRIHVGCRETDGSWLLDLTDNGIGIESRFAERVFVIFQRLHTKEAYAGTGIGLAICKKIVEFHGGRIWVDTEHHPGTRICWTFPEEERHEHR
jgi:signal transduction histidine kinase